MGDLTFQIEENPPWRQCRGRVNRPSASASPGLTSSEMLETVSKRVEEYEKLPEKAKEFCKKRFSRSMAIEYVHHSNVGESVGTQAFEDTLALLENVLKAAELNAADGADPSDNKRRKRERLESINTCKALMKCHHDDDVRDDNKQATGIVSVQWLCDVHKVLLENLHPNNGKIRDIDQDVFTETEDGIHYYPDGQTAEQRLYSLIDHHNIHMLGYRERMSTKEKVEFIVKCAARLLFEFVDTHPFSDGNGRMCRLLANYVVSLITPFPVAVYHPIANHPKRSHRDDYIYAIIKCRKDPTEGPRDLAAMILEGIYIGWESLFRNLKALRLLEVGKHLGPIVVMKSNLQDLEGKLSRACKGSVAVEKVIDIVRHAISQTDVSSLKPQFGYTRVSVNIDERMSITVDIYP